MFDIYEYLSLLFVTKIDNSMCIMYINIVSKVPLLVPTKQLKLLEYILKGFYVNLYYILVRCLLTQNIFILL